MSCPPDKIVFDAERGEYICTETGEVIEEKVIDQGPEWRAYTAEEKIEKSRVGSPINQAIHDFGFSTVISLNKKVKKRSDALKLIKLHKKARLTPGGRALITGMSDIGRIVSQLGLPKAVRDEAAMIYRKALERGILKGRSIISLVAACIYIACRKMRIPVTVEEIEKYTDVDKLTILKYYRLLVFSLKIPVPPGNETVNSYILKWGNSLGLSISTINKALEFSEKLKEKLPGKNPRSIAAALLYICSILNNERRTQKEITKVSGITDYALRKAYKEITRILGIKIRV